MASVASAMRSVGTGVGSLLATIAGGLYLIVLYLFTVWLVVGSLTAIQIRDDALQINKDVTFADVERSYHRHNTLIAQIYSDAERQANPFLDELDRLEMRIYEAMGHLAQPGGDLSAISSDAFEQSIEYLERQKACEAFDADAGKCQQVQELGLLFAARAEIRGKLDYSSYNRVYTDADARVAELRAAEPLARFFDTYEFFNFMPLYDEFLKEPQQILVLQLTIVMGMLGSVLTMTWSFIKNDSGFTFRRFVILPFVGAMSAFIIFVFIKAGQLTLTAGSATDQLNPFVLSFVGIISGLLSERAYSRMAEVGGSFFRVDEEKARYGLGLREMLTSSGMTEEELAAYLRLSTEETAAIIDGKTGATALQQQLVAASLRRSARELFTDLPPDTAAQPG
jgi:hypothetical protein